MPSKTLIYLAAFVGSIIGGYIPTLWGAGLFSISSLLASGLGAIIAILITARYV